MSVYYYEPFYDFDRFFDGVFGRQGLAGQGQQNTGDNQNAVTKAIKPRMDLHENAEKNLVTATFELPGLKKEDVQIDIHGGRLTVSGETKVSEEHQQEGYAIRERRYGKFSRTLQLPQGIKEDEIKASLEDGVLNVTFPKVGKETAPKKITVS
ncbi:small heat shock protein [Moniliophthora roreri MCA 2997]|uniref:Small heat shock protein n=2 Tax=Moniliophthora roreri TaxID=221103 RepID=V2YP85_MONRO|nr:small heat shock protein [Moniliophthora roreri MCA 2997]KAI3611424.1 small heat shock protein [Moniliophthora roreri]